MLHMKGECGTKLRALQKSYHSEKLSQSICHCEECNDAAIFNFIDQKYFPGILTTIILC